tara:strand:- start:1983 stop:2780 length:798 start_codon:yes stop_codon:yes gene_type:complete
MDFLHIIFLALIQGLTEFLPVSSSAHLILPAQLLGWEDQGLLFDIAVHLGSLGAVMLYFRQDIIDLLRAWLRSCIQREHTDDSRFAWLIILATLPAVLLGLVCADFIDLHLRSAQVIAITTLVFGVLLWWSDRAPSQKYHEKQLTWKKALAIGLAQALALIPGTSRSGITITVGLMLGLTRVAAARFSFLLSIPLILGASAYMSAKWFTTEQILDAQSLGLGIVLSFIAAYLCIHFFLKVIQKMGLLPFVLYRLALAVVLFYVFF